MRDEKRAERMIEADRYGFVGKSKDLIRLDAERLIKEYFCLTKPVTVEINGEGDDFDLVIKSHGNRVRSPLTLE